MKLLPVALFFVEHHVFLQWFQPTCLILFNHIVICIFGIFHTIENYIKNLESILMKVLHIFCLTAHWPYYFVIDIFH
jgi:hypothetical protein